MNFLGVALIGVITAGSGLALNVDRPLLTNQSQIAQAAADDTLRVNPAAKFTPQEPSKKRFRTLWNMFKSEPWRLSRKSAGFSPRMIRPTPGTNIDKYMVSITIQSVIALPTLSGCVASHDMQDKRDHCSYMI
jgi:hypothetical protein